MILSELASILEKGKGLSEAQARDSARIMTEPSEEPAEKARFLTLLAKKGESTQEVAGFVDCFRELARNPGLEKWSDAAIDVCGTGGDKQSTFNISTTVTFVLAAGGVPVLKHGNRSITSKCGSANLLEAVGVDLMANDATLARSMEELGFCFMFAPAFHPAFKEIMPVRQLLAEKGQRTIFNILGPLINPARPATQLLGVFSSSVQGICAAALGKVGVKRGLVAHCDLGDRGGMDELSVAGRNLLKGFGDLEGFAEELDLSGLGLESGNVSDLKGGDVETNVRILDTILEGKGPRALEDSIVLNAAMGLFIAGKETELAAAVGSARDLLLGGATSAKIADAKEFYA